MAPGRSRVRSVSSVTIKPKASSTKSVSKKCTRSATEIVNNNDIEKRIQAITDAVIVVQYSYYFIYEARSQALSSKQRSL